MNNISLMLNAGATDAAGRFLILDFEVPTELTFEQVSELRIDQATNRSALPGYEDSIFEAVYNSGKFNMTITRRYASRVSTAASAASAPAAQPVRASLCLSSQRTLIVSKLGPDSEAIDLVGRVARVWQRLAMSKSRGVSGVEKDIFLDVELISKLIAQCMENPLETSWIWNAVFVCKDETLDEIQAIALIDMEAVSDSRTGACRDRFSKMTISHIVTHPRNVRAEINVSETTRVEGAASAIIHHLIAHERPSSIYVESVRSAERFYKKLGFEEMDATKYPPREFGTTPMQLTAESISNTTQQPAA